MKEQAGKTQREIRRKKKKRVEGTKEIHNRENEERTPTILLHLAALPQ
jgi:hypothetical protein